MRAQYTPYEFEIIDEQVNDLMDDIIPEFDKDELIQTLLALLRGDEILDERFSPTSTSGRAAKCLLALWNNENNFLRNTFTDKNDPTTVALLRTAILQSLINRLHEYFTKSTERNHIITTSFNDSLTGVTLSGMPLIRMLFQEYMEKTQPSTFERYLLALRILLEKEVLGLLSRIVSTDNILTQSDSAPGDFSHLDLRALTITREAPGSGEFYNLQLQNSQCDNTFWKKVCLEQTDFTGTTLTHAVFESVVDLEDKPLSQEQLILDPTLNPMQTGNSLVFQAPTFSPEQLRDIHAVRDQLNKEIMSCWPYPNKDRKRIKLAALDDLIRLGERGEETTEKLVQFIIEKYGIETTAGERSHRVSDLFARLQESTPSQQARQYS